MNFMMDVGRMFPRAGFWTKHFYPASGFSDFFADREAGHRSAGIKVGPALTIRRCGSCTSPARPFLTAPRKRNVKVLPCELLVQPRRSLIVSGTATRLGWKLRWKCCAIAIGSGRRPWMISSWRRKSAGGSCDATVSGIACVKKPVANLPASVRQRRLNLAAERKQRGREV